MRFAVFLFALICSLDVYCSDVADKPIGHVHCNDAVGFPFQNDTGGVSDSSITSAPTSRGSSVPLGSVPGSPNVVFVADSALTEDDFVMSERIFSSVDLTPREPPSPDGYNGENEGSFCKDKSNRSRARRTPPPVETHLDRKPTDFMLAILSAIAYEAYKSVEIEKFPKPYSSPADFLKSIGYVTIDNGSFIVVSKELEKDIYIAFPGTQWDNLLFSIGSCDSWTRDQYDRAGNALVPHFMQKWFSKPYTFAMCLTSLFSLCGFLKTIETWTCSRDPLIYCGLCFMSFLMSTVMYFNIVPKIASSGYMEHMVDLYTKVQKYIKDKQDIQINFVGHSFGGQTAQVMAGLFPGSKAVSFSAPGGGFELALKANGYAHTRLGVKIPLLTSQDEWEDRVLSYALAGDPVINLKHKHDVGTIEVEEEGSARGLQLHRIAEIFKCAYIAYLCKLHQTHIGTMHS